MAVTAGRFIEILRKFNLLQSILDDIHNKDESPLNYAAKLLKGVEENNIDHSYRVLKSCIELASNSKSITGFTPEDYVCIFYASLLHDIAKSKSKEVQYDIQRILNCKCNLFSHEASNHGIRSAHYVEEKLNQGEIKLYGLNDSKLAQMLNIISFHSTGEMHSCFFNDRDLSRKELFLCLAFWLADTSDATYYRTEGPGTIEKKRQSGKTKARGMVERVSVHENYIVWRVRKDSADADLASAMENQKLSKHSVLLHAFGMPREIICLEQRKKIPASDLSLKYDEVVSSNLCIDVSKRTSPLVLSASTLPELYEKMVGAFYRIKASDSLSHLNYSGPLVLEVTNIESDKAKETMIRGEPTKKIEDIRSYAQRWLDKAKTAHEDFYFGYTHGQRISGYVYPRDIEDLSSSFHDWQGTVDQFKHVVNILTKERLDARRGYVVIPHPVIDNPESPIYKRHKEKDEVAPALIAIQFTLEEDNKLSAFALLRSQELSIFSLVNYFEIRELLRRLKNKLADSIADIRLGRIVMMTASGYFAPGTPLLDKPEICKIPPANVESYGRKIDLEETRQKFIDLLGDFQRDYIRIETHWIRDFLRFLPRRKQLKEIREAAHKLAKDLDSLEKKRRSVGYSATHPDIREPKKAAVEGFISVIEGYSK